MSDVSRESERDEQRQMLSLPSDGASAAQWCELANDLAEDRDRLLALVEQQEKALREIADFGDLAAVRIARAALSGGSDE